MPFMSMLLLFLLLLFMLLLLKFMLLLIWVIAFAKNVVVFVIVNAKYIKAELKENENQILYFL